MLGNVGNGEGVWESAEGLFKRGGGCGKMHRNMREMRGIPRPRPLQVDSRASRATAAETAAGNPPEYTSFQNKAIASNLTMN